MTHTREKVSPLCHTDGHLSSQECRVLEQKHQKYEGRVVTRGDLVKDHSGAHAVFTEQGPSAFADGCCKSNARHCEIYQDALDKPPKQYLRVRMEDAPRLLKNPKSECPDVRIRLPRHQWPQTWSNIEDPVLLERNLCGHPLGFLWEGHFGEVPLELG